MAGLLQQQYQQHQQLHHQQHQPPPSQPPPQPPPPPPPPPQPQPQEDFRTADTRGTRGACNGRRPASHFCACCSCLMLTSERLPVRLEPCGHVTCSRCAEPDTVISCPTCRASVVRGRPDNSLQIEVVNYFSPYYASHPATSATTSDSNVPVVPIFNAHAFAPQLQLEEQKSRSKRQSHQSNTKQAWNRSESNQWHQQLEMIGTRMHSLEATLEQLKTELGALTKELADEMARERHLKQLEIDTRGKLDRLQENLRSLSEQKASSVEAQANVQSQMEAKKRVIQGVSAAQHSMSMELSKLQALCSSGSETHS